MSVAVDYRRHGSKISATALALFQAAGVNASRLDREFDRRVNTQWPLVLWGHRHYRAKKIRDRTGIPIEMISRERRTILIRVVWPNPYVVYEEESQKKCYIEIPEAIPASVRSIAIGRRVGDIVEGLGMLGELKIASIRDEGWRPAFMIEQSWQTVR